MNGRKFEYGYMVTSILMLLNFSISCSVFPKMENKLNYKPSPWASVALITNKIRFRVVLCTYFNAFVIVEQKCPRAVFSIPKLYTVVSFGTYYYGSLASSNSIDIHTLFF